MCATCGCGNETSPLVTDPRGPGGGRAHHDHDHGHAQPQTETVLLEQQVLAKNDRLATRTRARLDASKITAINLMSAPGAGKTTLLERTIVDLRESMPIAVIEGDQQTVLDAERIGATGCPVVQVNTGAGCHLDARMMHDALADLDPDEDSLLFVENVGNLVCPALFDLGEQAKVVIISTTEGADKPLKYPHIFAAADLVIVNKIDLLPYVDFDLEICARHVESVNPDVEVIALSTATGMGLDKWYRWIAGLRLIR